MSEFILAGGGGFRLWGPDAFPSYAQLTRDYLGLGTFNVAVGVAGADVIFGAGPGGTSCGLFIPSRLGGAVSQDQFSRFTYVSNTAPAVNVTRPFLVVFATGDVAEQNNTLNCYGLLIRQEVPNAQVIKGTGYEASFPGGVVNTVLGTIAAPAIGNVVEIQAAVVAGDTVLTVLYNGAIVAGTPITDPAPGNFTNGLPGFGSRSSTVGAGDNFHIAAYTGGAL